MPVRFTSPAADRAVVLLRALLAGAAALVVTFVQDRTPGFALAAFQIFAYATAVLLFADALFVRGRRSPALSRVLAALYLIAGALCTLLPGDPAAVFHIVVVGWAAAAGAVELIAGIAARGRRPSPEARDAIAVGGLTVLLAAVSLVVSPGYALEYAIEEAGRSFTLTGTIIGVGLFGGWAALVAVYLAIGALSPTPQNKPLSKDA
ncbi:acyl-CoA synthetase [Microbacterium excoecariae]|uniref:acyl-CoA synthetase n=1 Tax=Microbacterium excoecariae TaxID=2715210 RepID=UPI00140B4C35|nr:acyl-CoA synthetase [Microbacterium excoecariae]NHI16024.1 acyl-CoA synthetase [Microbacterium excoecariae]